MVRICLGAGIAAMSLALALFWLIPRGGESEQGARRDNGPFVQAISVSDTAVYLNASESDPLAGSGMRLGGVTEFHGAPPDDDQQRDVHQRSSDRVHADSLFALRWAASQGLPRDAVDRILRGIHPSALVTFFEERTHIDRAWLQRNGLDESILPELFRMYADSSVTPGTEQAAEPVGLSTYALRQGGMGVYTDSFADQNSTVFLHYTIPPDYQPDGVIIRWVDTDNRSLVHVDRHLLNATPHERQEAWIRQPEGWAPGNYRIEVFGADAELSPIAAIDYRVFRYGVD